MLHLVSRRALARWLRSSLVCLFSLGLALAVLLDVAPGRAESAPNPTPVFTAVISLTIPLISPKPTSSRTSSSTPAAAYRVFLPLLIASGAASANAAPAPAWLTYLNDYRRASGLSPLTENKTWSEACWKHARYLVNNNTVSHTEDPSLPWYTAAGDAAGRVSNVIGASVTIDDEQALIDSWLSATFHAVGMLDPRWSKTGLGVYQDAGANLKTAACLDILRGQSEARTDAPVMFPGKGSTTNNLAHQYEWPNPASSCQGYAYPMGAPIILQLGSDGTATNVTQTSLTANPSTSSGPAQAVEHCQINASNYTNSDSYSQAVGRNVLGNSNAVTLLPRSPLSPDTTYAVTMTVGSKVYAWTFKTAATASY